MTIRFGDWEDAIKAMRFFEERRFLELEKYRMSLETGHAQAAGFCGGYPVLALGASAGNNVEYAGPYGYPVPGARDGNADRCGAWSAGVSSYRPPSMKNQSM